MSDVRKATARPTPVRITLEVTGPLTRAQIVARARQAFGRSAVLVSQVTPPPAPAEAVAPADPFAALDRLSRQLKARSGGRPTAPAAIEAFVDQVRAERRAAAASAE